MRIDKYLMVSRLGKRRTVANELCDAGNVSANGRPVRASYSVGVGDIITLTMGVRTIRVRVEEVEESAAKNKAREMYTVIE